jgi:hypothetical protein
MKTNKKKAGQAKPNNELKGTEKHEINNAFANAEGDPEETILCVPGGKCYTRAEIAALEKPVIPPFEMEGESDDAES